MKEEKRKKSYLQMEGGNGVRALGRSPWSRHCPVDSEGGYTFINKIKGKKKKKP